MATQAPLDLAKESEPYLFSIRNHLHENPELGWQENQSLAFIRSKLLEIKALPGRNLKIYDNYEGGLVADITFPNTKQTLLFRSDIDALPIQEDPSHKLISKHTGKMHACGHDVHSAMLLTAARILLTDKEIMPLHNLRLVWQRAEETPGLDPIRHSGGFTLVREGVLDGVDEVHGIHVWSRLPSGIFYSKGGPLFGSTSTLFIEIQASGGHTSSPHQGTNALRVANSVMEALKDLPVRFLGPTAIATLEPTVLQSGDATNAMPSNAKLVYSVRSLLSEADFASYQKMIKHIVESISEQFDTKIQVNFKNGYPTLFNNQAIFEKDQNYLIQNGLKVKETSPVLAGEDFSYYLEKKPGVFWLLGASQPVSGPHHSPTFQPDSKVFYQGVALWLLLATQA